MRFTHYFYYATLILSFLSSLLVYRQKDAGLYLRLFPHFLFLTLIVEGTGMALMLQDINNMVLYNYFSVLEFIFYFFVFSQLLVNRQAQAACFFSILAYPVIALLNIIFLTDKRELHYTTYGIGAILVCVFSGYSLYEIYIKQNLRKGCKRLPGLCVGSPIIRYS